MILSQNDLRVTRDVGSNRLGFLRSIVLEIATNRQIVTWSAVRRYYG